MTKRYEPLENFFKLYKVKYSFQKLHKSLFLKNKLRPTEWFTSLREYFFEFLMLVPSLFNLTGGIKSHKNFDDSSCKLFGIRDIRGSCLA